MIFTLPCLALPCLTLPCLALPYLILPYLTLPFTLLLRPYLCCWIFPHLKAIFCRLDLLAENGKQLREVPQVGALLPHCWRMGTFVFPWSCIMLWCPSAFNLSCPLTLPEALHACHICAMDIAYDIVMLACCPFGSLASNAFGGFSLTTSNDLWDWKMARRSRRDLWASRKINHLGRSTVLPTPRCFLFSPRSLGCLITRMMAQSPVPAAHLLPPAPPCPASPLPFHPTIVLESWLTVAAPL